MSGDSLSSGAVFSVVVGLVVSQFSVLSHVRFFLRVAYSAVCRDGKPRPSKALPRHSVI